jgi:hypothetical protein
VRPDNSALEQAAIASRSWRRCSRMTRQARAGQERSVSPPLTPGVSRIIVLIASMLVLHLLACGTGTDRDDSGPWPPCAHSTLLGAWWLYEEPLSRFFVMDFQSTCNYTIQLVSASDTSDIIHTDGPWPYSVRGDTLNMWSAIGESAGYVTVTYSVAGDTLKLLFDPANPQSELRFRHGFPVPNRRGITSQATPKIFDVEDGP